MHFLSVILFTFYCLIGFSQTKKQTKLAMKFAKTDNDSAFINKYSDFDYELILSEKNFFSGFKSDLDSVIFHSEVNSIVGPFENDSLIFWFKIISVDSSIRMNVGNIWINPWRNLDSSKLIAEKVFEEAKNGISFNLLCLKYTGDHMLSFECNLGWFWKETMVPEFGNAILNYKRDDIFMVQTQYGFHIVKVLNDYYKDRKTVKSIPLILRKVKVK